MQLMGLATTVIGVVVVVVFAFAGGGGGGGVQPSGANQPSGLLMINVS